MNKPSSDPARRVRPSLLTDRVCAALHQSITNGTMPAETRLGVSRMAKESAAMRTAAAEGRILDALDHDDAAMAPAPDAVVVLLHDDVAALRHALAIAHQHRVFVQLPEDTFRPWPLAACQGCSHVDIALSA